MMEPLSEEARHELIVVIGTGHARIVVVFLGVDVLLRGLISCRRFSLPVTMLIWQRAVRALKRVCHVSLPIEEK